MMGKEGEEGEVQTTKINLPLAVMPVGGLLKSVAEETCGEREKRRNRERKVRNEEKNEKNNNLEIALSVEMW